MQKMVPRPADAKTASPSRMDQPAIEPPKNVLSQYPVLYKSLDGTATSAVVFLCAEHQPELGWLYLYSGREMMARCSLATWHNYLNSDKDLIAQFKGSSQKITTYTLGFSSPSSAMEFLKMVLELKAGKYLNQVTDKASAPAAQKAATAGPALGQASASTIPNAARVSSKISQVVTTAPSIVQELNAAAQQTSLPCDTSHSRKNAAVNSHYRSQPKSVSGPQKTATRTPENASVVSAGPGVISTSCPKDHPDVQRLTKQLEELKLNSPEKGPRSLQNTLIENKDQSSLATKNISARDCAQSMSLIDLDESQVVKRRLPSASEDLASLEPFEYPPSPSVPGDVISMQMTSGAETLGSTLNSEETVLDSLRETARQVLGSCLLQGQAGNTKAEIGNFFQGVVLAIGEAYIKSNDDLAALDDEAQRKAMKDFVAVFFQKSMSDLFQDTDHQAQDTNSASSPGRPEVAQAGAKTQKPQDVPNTTGMAANTRYSVEQLVSVRRNAYPPPDWLSKVPIPLRSPSPVRTPGFQGAAYNPARVLANCSRCDGWLHGNSVTSVPSETFLFLSNKNQGPVVKNPDVLQPGAKSTVNANTETTGVSDKPGVFENVTKAQSTKTTAHANGNGLEESKLVDINHRATLTTKQARKDEGLLASKWATEEDSLVNEKNFTGPAYEFPANSNLWLLAELDPETGLDTKPEIPSNDVANFFLSGPPTQPESTLPTPSQTSSESGKIVLSGPMSSASSVTRGFKGLKASRWA